MTAEPRLAADGIVVVSGLSEIAGRYDAFIVDLWGTIHDGVRPLPGALDALSRLRESRRRILVLSNAPRRVDAVVARMRGLGIPDDLWDDALSSGEATWLALRDRPDDFHRHLGDACYLIGGEGDDSAVAGLGLELVDDVTRADFVAAIGLDGPERTVADYEPVLRAARARDLPMVCANPDLEVLRGGKRELCAGSLAARYEEVGGRVCYHGKPHAGIYRLARARLGLADPRRILAVGDSLPTDVAGAAAAGMDSLLITGGLHAEALGLAWDEAPEPRALARFCAEQRQQPTWAAGAFRW